MTHVIVRFVDGVAFMDETPGAREQYLARLDCVLPDSDWVLCWYCLMGTHVHLGMVAGEQPLQAWIGRVNSGWANWINRNGRRRGLRSRGPIVAERPSTLLVPDHRARHLGAYIHNNPVRAGLVDSADASLWTSHRAYLALEPGPAMLDIARGLEFCDAMPTPEGRQRFHEYVLSRAGDPRDPELAGRTAARERNVRRRLEGRSVELQTPLVYKHRAVYPVTFAAHAYRPRIYGGDVTAFLQSVATHAGIRSDDLVAKGRERWRSGARRLAVLAWRLAGRPTSELCAALAISASSATNLVRSARAHDRELARRVVTSLLNESARTCNSEPRPYGPLSARGVQGGS